MSLRIIECEVVQKKNDVSYRNGTVMYSVLLGPKQIEMRLETDGPFPGLRGYATLEDWFIDNIVPTLPPEQLRRIITKATVQLLNPA